MARSSKTFHNTNMLANVFHLPPGRSTKISLLEARLARTQLFQFPFITQSFDFAAGLNRIRCLILEIFLSEREKYRCTLRVANKRAFLSSLLAHINKRMPSIRRRWMLDNSLLSSVAKDYSGIILLFSDKRNVSSYVFHEEQTPLTENRYLECFPSKPTQRWCLRLPSACTLLITFIVPFTLFILKARLMKT